MNPFLGTALGVLVGALFTSGTGAAAAEPFPAVDGSGARSVVAASDTLGGGTCVRELATMRAMGLEMINQHRVAAGAEALRPHPGLDQVAQDWSITMARTGDFVHNPSFSEQYPPGVFGWRGENIARNSDGPTVTGGLHLMFVHSPGHLENMLRPQYTHAGLGYACVRDGPDHLAIFTTQNFGEMHDTSTLERPPAPLPRPLPAACPAALTTPNPYYDIVPDGHGHSVLCLNAWGMTSPARDFYRYLLYEPQTPADRAAFAEMLHRLLRTAGVAPAGSLDGRFTDVSSTHPNARAINALASLGIIQGVTTTRFDPGRRVTRGQMSSLLVRAHELAFSRTFPIADGFTDTAGTSHAGNSRRLVGAGIAVGYPDGTFRPQADMTRGQMATFHARYANLLVAERLTQLPTSRTTG